MNANNSTPVATPRKNRTTETLASIKNVGNISQSSDHINKMHQQQQTQQPGHTSSLPRRFDTGTYTKRSLASFRSALNGQVGHLEHEMANLPIPPKVSFEKVLLSHNFLQN